MTLVITTCTNRKRKPVSERLHMAVLPRANLYELAEEWSRRLGAEPTRFRGDEIYGGRGFREAVTAAKLLDARMLVVSAGLGLIDVCELVPPYACTVLVGAADSVAGRVKGGFDAAEWWRCLNEASPFSVALQGAVAASEGLICAALSEAYIELVAADFAALPPETLERVRLFTRAPIEGIPASLRRAVMPYDDRLDGPDSAHRGTRSDFAGRALRHFSEMVVGTDRRNNVRDHAVAVETVLSGWRMPAQFARVRHDDTTLLSIVRDHWDVEGGSSSRLLRRLRDQLGIACEQGRFARLARMVRDERA